MADTIRLLRLPDVIARRGRSRAGLYAEIQRGLFPPPIHHGRCATWPEHEVNAVLSLTMAGVPEDRQRITVTQIVRTRALALGALRAVELVVAGAVRATGSTPQSSPPTQPQAA